MFPDNPTGIGVATVFRWIAILLGGIQLWTGVSALTSQKAWVSKTEVVHGKEAVAYGWSSIGWAVGCGVIALAIWFFFERDSD